MNQVPVQESQQAQPAQQPRSYVTNRMRFMERRAPAWLSLAGVIIILLIWQLVSTIGIVSEADLPSPLNILSAAWMMAKSGDLWVNIGASLSRIVIGYLIGSIVGIVIGILLGFSRVTERVGLPVVNSLYPIPKLAIIPLIILWVGAGETSKILVIAAEVMFPVLFNTYSGVRNTDQMLIKMAVSFGATRSQLIRQVILPASLPMIFSGLRIGAGLSLLILIAAEMIGAEHGIGAMLLQYSSLMETANVMVGVVILSILGLILAKGLAFLEKLLLPWKS